MSASNGRPVEEFRLIVRVPTPLLDAVGEREDPEGIIWLLEASVHEAIRNALRERAQARGQNP